MAQRHYEDFDVSDWLGRFPGLAAELGGDSYVHLSE